MTSVVPQEVSPIDMTSQGDSGVWVRLFIELLDDNPCCEETGVGYGQGHDCKGTDVYYGEPIIYGIEDELGWIIDTVEIEPTPAVFAWQGAKI